MISHFDMVEQLGQSALDSQFIHSTGIDSLKNHVICIHSSYLINKLVNSCHPGDLLTGISVRTVKAALADFKAKMDALQIKFKVVFNGAEIFSEKGSFQAHSQLHRKFFHQLWKLETALLLVESLEVGAEKARLIEELSYMKTVARESQLYRLLVEKELAEFLHDCMFQELEIEFVRAPNRANNQLVWFYSYDYCEAIVGNLSLLPFSDTLPQVILDLDLQSNTFSYISTRDFNDALKLVKGKEKRQFELWGFAIPAELCTEHDVAIVKALDEKIFDMQPRLAALRLETSDKLRVIHEKLSSVFNRIDCNAATGNDKAFADTFALVTNEKPIRREHHIFRIDYGQVINSSCEFSPSPGVKTYLMNEADKNKFKAALVYDFNVCKKLCPFSCFDVFNSQFISMVSKVSKNSIYFGPPLADSKEHRFVVEELLAKDLECSFTNFVYSFGKTLTVLEFMLHGYSLKEPVNLKIKDHFTHLESGEKIMHYFKDAAFKKFEKDTGAKTATSFKPSFKQIVTMAFHCFKSSPDSSDLTLSPMNAKKGSPPLELSLSKREVSSMVCLSLLEELDYLSSKQKSFKILGAGLMRKGLEQFEEKLVLLLEMMRINLMNGEFMNPPETSLLKHHKKRDDKYLAQSLRKTSEEVRVRPRPGMSQLEEDSAHAATQKRKESEFVLHLDHGDLSREPSNYDFSKLLSSISYGLLDCREAHQSLVLAQKQIPEESLEILAAGIAHKAIPRILMIARVFALIDAKVDMRRSSKRLLDFDTAQFVAVAATMQRLLRFKVEGYFSFAIHTAGKQLSLRDIEDLKAALPFRSHLTGHLSSLVKHLLTKFAAFDQATKAKSQLAKQLDPQLTLQHLEKAFPEFETLREDLAEGFGLFMSLVDILEYGIERGIDKGASPVLTEYLESKELLRDCFKKLGLADTN